MPPSPSNVINELAQIGRTKPIVVSSAETFMPRTHHHHYNYYFRTKHVARLAQLDSVSALYAEGRGSEPLTEQNFSDAPATWGIRHW
uniref:Uncharacterized protein n=1 Tax=Romanomermis culicivorax TaxID=13658 RepID=A0A915L1H0_ROMCU